MTAGVGVLAALAAPGVVAVCLLIIAALAAIPTAGVLGVLVVVGALWGPPTTGPDAGRVAR